jgi:hypothetical protein
MQSRADKICSLGQILNTHTVALHRHYVGISALPEDRMTNAVSGHFPWKITRIEPTREICAVLPK